MPRKMAGRAMMRLVWLSAAISTPKVVLDRAIHSIISLPPGSGRLLEVSPGSGEAFEL